MALYYPNMIQSSPYSYHHLGPNRVLETQPSAMLSPAQMQNFYCRPLAVIMDRNNGYSNYSANQVGYHHHIYGANPYFQSYPYPYPWHFPQMSPLPLYHPYANYRPYVAYHRPGWDSWPEGFTLRGELRWGRLERVTGPKRDLPEFVKDDLRRMYGTYPRTDVSITYLKGEFVVKGDPRTGEQEYRVEKRLIRKESTPTASEAEDSSEDRGKKKKKLKR